MIIIHNASDHILLVNHIGFDPSGTKKVILQTGSDQVPAKYYIRNVNHDTVYEGCFKDGEQTDHWYTGKAYVGYFSELIKEGSYKIICCIADEWISSGWFKIERDIIQTSCLPLLLEGFHSRHPEKKYEDKDRQISFFGSRNDQVDVHGGWYDASGDVSKYLSHLSYTNYFNPQQTPLVIWSMLESYERLEKKSYVSDKYRESLIKEAVYGADFLVRMQDPEGFFYMTVFDNWSGDPEKREICTYKGQKGIRSSDYQAGFRQGGGMAIAALAKASRSGFEGKYSKDIYIQKAIKGFNHLLEYNLQYIDNGFENIIDDYCFLLAATELYKSTNDKTYLRHARLRSQILISCLYSDTNYTGWWCIDKNDERPFFHASDAGLPLVALCNYLDIENDPIVREDVILSIRTSIDFELKITHDVNNPFGYARQYVKALDEPEPKASFFLPHKNESGYWWQGENARIASLATAMLMAGPYLSDVQKIKANEFAISQINWILGLNPYNTCMLDGIGHNNPEYLEPENVNFRGGICNGITSGFENENDISFMPLPYNNDPAQQWRWSEQWIPHAAWFMLAISNLK